MYDGTEPNGWIFKVERYFGVNRMTEEEKMEALVMDGEALVWFKWEGKRADFELGRDEGKSAALISTSQEGTLCAQLLAVRQATTVE